MNFDKFNQSISLIANLGVLAGIIFLGLEIQQNTKMTQAQTRDAMTEKQMAFYELTINDAALAGNYIQSTFPGLSDTGEALQVRNVVRFQFRMWENEWYQYEQGLFEEEEFAPRMELWRRLMLSDEYQRLWSSWRSEHAPSFAAQMDSIVAQINSE